jgi:hypothetical protein
MHVFDHNSLLTIHFMPTLKPNKPNTMSTYPIATADATTAPAASNTTVSDVSIPSKTPSPKLRSNWSTVFVEDLDAEEVMNEVKAELIIYKREGSMPMTTEDGKYSNPLGWWRKNAYKFPVLARLSRKLLAIPATSAPSERVWSRVSSVLTMKRARMKSDVASDIMYIRENIDILRKYYVTIAVQERGEMERSMIELEKMFLPPIEESLDDVGK